VKKLIYFFLLTVFFSCSKEDIYLNMNSYEEGEELSAGSLTTRILGSNAFDQSVPGLPINEDLLFFFRKCNF
jgi:hypothetical protein